MRLAAHHIILADEQLEIVSRRSEEQDADSVRTPESHQDMLKVAEARYFHDKSAGVDTSVPKTAGVR